MAHAVPKDKQETQADLEELKRLVPEEEYETQTDINYLRNQLEEYLSTDSRTEISEESAIAACPDLKKQLEEYPTTDSNGWLSEASGECENIVTTVRAKVGPKSGRFSKKKRKKKVEKEDYLSKISLADERGGRRRGKNVGDDYFIQREVEAEAEVKKEEEKKQVVKASTEVILNSKVTDPRVCEDGYILLAKESFKHSPRGKIGLGPVPFLGHFTAFGRAARVAIPPKVQSRWKLVKIPLRGDFGPRCPFNKYDHPLHSQSSQPDSKEYRRPLIPIDPKKKRRILHKAFPVSGDKNHLFKLLIPSGYFRRKVGGGWICRRWIKRRWPRQLINHTAEEWKAALALKEKKEKTEEEIFKANLTEVWNGIIGLDQGVMKETFMTLVKENERRAEKKQEMYDGWDLTVFNYIQRQTQDLINDDHYDPKAMTAKHMDLQRKYCKAMQRRKVFLDIIHPDEYDPHEYQNTKMTYSTKKLYDPVKHDWLKEKQEKAFMGEAVFDTPRTRHTFDLAYWPEPEYKCSMAGRVCCDIEFSGERKNLAPVPEKWASHPIFYNKRWGPEEWHTSFPKGGKLCDGLKPPDNREVPDKPWKGLGIVWDAPQKHQQKLQISEENPWF